MIIIIDRFEGDFAVVETENEELINMPRELLPKEAKGGSVISIEIDKEETKKREQKISKLMNDVWND